MKRYINLEAIIEGCICLIFSGLMFYITYSGKYLMFVTPRMKPYLYFTAVMLLIWAISRLKQAGKPRYKVQLTKCLVLVLPLMILLIPDKSIASATPDAPYSNIAGTSSLNGGIENTGGDKKSGSSGQNAGKQKNGSSNQNPIPQADNPGQTGQLQQYNGPGQGSGTQQAAGSIQGGSKPHSDSGLKTKVPSGLDDSNRSIVVSDKEFYQWLVELSQHQDKYEGYQIQIHGTIYRDQTMAQDEFAVSRVLMSCCVADLSDCGPICKYQGAADLENKKWVTVTGTVHFDKTKGIEIKVSQIQDAKPAAEQYVYPFAY